MDETATDVSLARFFSTFYGLSTLRLDVSQFRKHLLWVNRRNRGRTGN